MRDQIHTITCTNTYTHVYAHKYVHRSQVHQGFLRKFCREVNTTTSVKEGISDMKQKKMILDWFLFSFVFELFSPDALKLSFLSFIKEIVVCTKQQYPLPISNSCLS